MTHPFHPLRGRVFQLESCRHAWGEARVYFYDEEGQLRHLPATWTDIAETDPFVAVASGRAHFRPSDLLSLSRLVRELDEEGRCGV